LLGFESLQDTLVMNRFLWSGLMLPENVKYTLEKDDIFQSYIKAGILDKNSNLEIHL